MATPGRTRHGWLEVHFSGAHPVHRRRDLPPLTMGTLLGQVLCLPQRVTQRSMAIARTEGTLPMNAPVRKPVVPAEATQELQAADVLEVLGAKGVANLGAARRPLGSQSSIAPVGLDLAVGDDEGDEDDVRSVTSGHVLGGPRKRFKGLVVGVVSGCALILVAAGVARVVHASDETSSASHASAPAAVTTTQAVPPPAIARTPVPSSPPPVGAAAPAPDGMTTGTVRLDRPAKVGRVWLDGKKLTSPSALVSCGTHRIKVGYGRTHSIDVPCGGEIGVSR